MSIAPRFDAENSPETLATVRRIAFRPVETAAFWAAVALPLAYVALMVGGLDGHDLLLLVGVAAVHVLALGLGRDHAR
ncbi:MAG: hypothetical protein ABEJ89_10430 [Haloarculaceae archaeon]